MEKSAGVLIKCKDRVLLCKATNFNNYTPPKGHIEEGECLKETACRELYEEVGIKLNPRELMGEPHEVRYKSRGGTGKTRKIVYIYFVEIESLDEIGLVDYVIPENMLQLEEVDKASFYTIEEAKRIILRHYLPLFETLFK